MRCFGHEGEGKSSPVLIKIDFVVDPLHAVNFLFFLRFRNGSRANFGFNYTQHLVFTFIDPLIEDEIGYFVVFLLVLKTSDDYTFNKIEPIGYSFH